MTYQPTSHGRHRDKHEASGNWHNGDKVFRTEKHQRAPREDLGSLERPAKNIAARDHMDKTVPNTQKSARNIPPAGPIEQRTKKPVYNIPPAAPIEQKEKRVLAPTHWDKSIPAKAKPGERKGWETCRRGHHEGNPRSSMDKRVIDPSPRRVHPEKPPIEQPKKLELSPRCPMRYVDSSRA